MKGKGFKWRTYLREMVVELGKKKIIDSELIDGEIIELDSSHVVIRNSLILDSNISGRKFDKNGKEVK